MAAIARTRVERLRVATTSPTSSPRLNLTDHDLIARVRLDDDRHAFGELVRRHQSAVRGFLRRLTGGQHALADDLAQETFLSAYRDLGRYRGEAAFSTWLMGVAYNHFRSARRRERPSVEWTGEVPAEALAAGHEAAVAPTTGAVDLREDLNAALGQLSREECAALHLCYAEGLTHEEAATALGCPLGTVKTHVLRAKEKLRRLLRAWAPV